MILSEVQKTIDFSNSTPIIRKIFNQIHLNKFYRGKDGGFKTFYFDFTYKGKPYTLKHTFYYHGAGIDNWFKFKKPSLFSPKPFDLTKDEFCELSALLMLAVNKCN